MHEASPVARAVFETENKMVRRNGNGTAAPTNDVAQMPSGLSTLIASLAEPALIVRAGSSEICLINAEAAALFGYAPEDLTGQAVEVLIPHRFHARHVAYGAAAADLTRSRQMGEGTNLVGLRRDGSEFPVEITLSPLATRNGAFVAAIVRDVTASRQTAHDLARSEERYRKAVSAISEGIVIMSADGSMEPCNDTARQIMGPVSPAGDGSLTHLPADWQFVDEKGERLPGDQWPGVTTLQTGVGTRDQIVGLVRPDHPLTWFSISAQPLFEADAEKAYASVFTFSDVTDQLRAVETLRSSEEYLRQRTRDLEHANSQLAVASKHLTELHADTVIMLAAVAEAHDRTTGEHLRSVRAITEALAQQLGYSEEDAAQIGLAAVLHDIGKIRVPEAILTRASSLGPEQWDVMKQHTVWGMDFLATRDRFLLAAQVARSHHERWDGGGYPDGLVGSQIPEEVAIVTVADSFDAMISQRPYRQPWPVERAIAEIKSCSGSQFSPRVAEALVHLYETGQLPLSHSTIINTQAA
jgi:PAS domain S-box-containing protein/putative nucleotidyltransferase with HDIG domain